MARVHTIEGSGKLKKCKTFINSRNGCKYTICKDGKRWKIQPGPICPNKR